MHACSFKSRIREGGRDGPPVVSLCILSGRVCCKEVISDRKGKEAKSTTPHASRYRTHAFASDDVETEILHQAPVAFHRL
jgi:hypothetical protein